jgi:prepilin-type processing-associated H-X9-DG protein
MPQEHASWKAYIKRPRSAAENPAQLILFADAYISGSGMGPSNYNWCTKWNGWANDPVNGKGIWFGHGQHANMSFSDGHCESLTKNEVHDGMFYMIDDR